VASRLAVELVEKLQALVKIASERIKPGRTFFERWFIGLHPGLSMQRLIFIELRPAFFGRNRIIKVNLLAGQDIGWKYAGQTLIIQ